MADSEPAHGFYNIPSQEPSKDGPPSPVGESPVIKPEVPVELTQTGVAGMQIESAVIFDQAEITRIQDEFDEMDRLESEDIAKANAQPEEPVHADQENPDAEPKKKNKSRGKKRSKAKAQAEGPAEIERLAALEQERLEREIEAQAIFEAEAQEQARQDQLKAEEQLRQDQLKAEEQAKLEAEQAAQALKDDAKK
jgi:membrane protein involved in colicin uptake